MTNRARGIGSNYSEELDCTDSTPKILVNFTDCIACRENTNSNGPIKIFSFTKGDFCDDTVTDINPKSPRPCPGIEIQSSLHLKGTSDILTTCFQNL